MKLDSAGTYFLKSLERKRLVAYRDQGGVWTISWGVTGPHVVHGLVINDAQAEQMFADALVPVEAAINKSVKVALSQNEYNALVAFVYNVGVHKFLHGDETGGPCDLLTKLNASDRPGAAREFDRWVHYKDLQTGYTLISEGLVKRRAKEKALFLAAAAAVDAA